MRLSKLQRTARRGFTLIEVVVATLVLSLILVSLYGTWQIIIRSTDRALQVTVNAQRARMAVRVVEEAVSAAQMFQANAGMYAFFADSSGQFSTQLLREPARIVPHKPRLQWQPDIPSCSIEISRERLVTSILFLSTANRTQSL